MSFPNLEKSMTYETIQTIVQDIKKAFDIYMLAETTMDLSDSFPLLSKKMAPLLGISSDEADAVWRKVRDVYSSKRLQYEIIDHSSPLFPHGLMESEFPVPMFYAIGNPALLEKPRITVLGSLSPTERARCVTRDFCSLLSSGKQTLVIPLELGIPSFAAAEVIKGGGNIIAVSSQFLSVAPVEALKIQMIDILNHGGLIVTPFGPCSKSEKWHNIIRNRAISSFSEAAFLVEEKDGGPAWKIFDLVPGDRRMISAHMLENPAFTFARSRVDSGVPAASGEKDYRSLLRKKTERKAKKIADELTPDLFELTNL